MQCVVYSNMRVTGREVLENLADQHLDVIDPIDAWYAEALDAEWKSPHELKERYPTASLLGGGRVVFNIKGNRYRILALVNYEYQSIMVLKAGTHDEYSKWIL